MNSQISILKYCIISQRLRVTKDTFYFIGWQAHVCYHHWVTGQVPACKQKFKKESIETHQKVYTRGLWKVVATLQNY